jgi:hypothetical protein
VTGLLPSASGLDRVSYCPPSAVLPAAGHVDSYSEGGNVGHEYLANIAGGMSKEDALLLAPPERRPWLAALDLDSLPVRPDQFQPELAFVYDRATGEAQVAGQRIDRGYAAALGRPLLETENGGTADAVALTVDGRGGVVADYKSGWAAHVAPARVNRQLRFLALCLARVYSLEHVVVAIIRFRDDGTPFFDRAEFDALEIEVIAAELDALAVQVSVARDLYRQGEMPMVTTGEHCRYCPALLFCPAQRAIIRAAVTEADQPESAFYALPDEDEAMDALLERARLAEKRVADLIDQIKLRASQRPFRRANGKWYGEVRRLGDPTYKPEQIQAVLVEKFGAEYAAKAVEQKATLAGIERAVKSWASVHGKKAGPIFQELEHELVDRGLIVRRMRAEVREFKATDAQIAEMLAARAKQVELQEPTQLEAPIETTEAAAAG